jgi:hypothetical protein
LLLKIAHESNQQTFHSKEVYFPILNQKLWRLKIILFFNKFFENFPGEVQWYTPCDASMFWPVTKFWAEQISSWEDRRENPLSENDCNPEHRSWLANLKESHQVHSLVLSLLLFKIIKIKF